MLQYGAGAGLGDLREAVCTLMGHAGIAADPADVLITAGSQMGLELVTALLCNPGDIVLVESPTYVGAISAFRGLEVVHVGCDRDGLIPEELEGTIAELTARGRTVRMLYTIPNFNNPSGITLHPDRRPLVAGICARGGVRVVEDDPYGLDFWDAPLRAIRSVDDTVIYLGSMSKIFAPGIRVGWVLAPRDVRDWRRYLKSRHRSLPRAGPAPRRRAHRPRPGRRAVAGRRHLRRRGTGGMTMSSGPRGLCCHLL